MALGEPILIGVSGDASNLVLIADCDVCFEPESLVALAEAAKSLMLSDLTHIQRLGGDAERVR